MSRHNWSAADGPSPPDAAALLRSLNPAQQTELVRLANTVNRGLLGQLPRGDSDDPMERLFAPRQSASPEKRALAAWWRAVATSPSGMAHLCTDDPALKRVLSISADAAGGYLVPSGFIPELIHDAPKMSTLYRMVRKIPVSQQAGTIPRTTANATVSWGTENVAIDEGDPAFGETAYNVHRLNSLVKTSRELAEDSNPGIVDVVSQLFTEAILAERDRVIAVGSGTGQPLGLYSAAGITDVSSVTTLTYGNLVSLKESVDDRYQSDPTFCWHFNQRVKAALMSLVDLHGQPILQRDPTEDFKARILGVPVVVENSFPNNYIGVGALRYYIWFDRGTLGIERTTEGGDAFSLHQL